jgi:archaellum biogenesis ATPase FlaH
MVTSEKRIVAACAKSRSAFDKIIPYIHEDNITPYSWYLIDLIGDFYSKDKTASKVELDYLLDKISLDLDNPKKVELYRTHAKECYDADVSAVNVAELILESKRKESAQALAQALVGSGASSEELLEKIVSHKSLLEASTLDDAESDSEVLQGLSVQDINSTVLDPKGRIKLLSKKLTEELNGGAIGGNVVWVFGRPEIGKSALVISMARALALQGLKGIFFENEDPIRSTIERVQACMTGMDSITRMQKPDEAQKILDSNGYNGINFVNIAPGSVPEIERMVERYEPKWIIVNQIRNLRTRAENRTNQLENIATDLRAVAKRNNLLLIGVTQAGDSASNKLVLDIGDVDSSNTGIPSQADVMIGIGANDEFLKGGYRMISLPKNKLSGRHVHFQMKINPQTSRMEDL